jgi:homoserine O-acetyltransferase
MNASARTILVRMVALALATVAASGPALGAEYPQPVEGDHLIPNFRFRSGEVLPELRIHYRTIGTAQRDDKGVVRNAVLILHGTGGQGGGFVERFAQDFAAQLFGPGQPLDAARYFIVLPDNLGHGKSSKPSDGLRAKFPRYGYLDMIEAQRRLLVDGLKVDHLHLVWGCSMGGMHTWLWGQLHSEFMDGLMPTASLPSQISGRNRVWRRIIIDAIRHDPSWRGGDYDTQPPALRTAAQVGYLMNGTPLIRQAAGPSLAEADKMLDQVIEPALARIDANDALYAVESSRDYDPAPGLGLIRAPLLAINFADDLINPPELGILEREIKRLKGGRAITVAASSETEGHGTSLKAVIWRQHLDEFMDALPHQPES